MLQTDYGGCCFPRVWGWGLLTSETRPQAHVWPWQGVLRVGKGSLV